jgi:hypothetical protein
MRGEDLIVDNCLNVIAKFPLKNLVISKTPVLRHTWSKGHKLEKPFPIFCQFKFGIFPWLIIILGPVFEMCSYKICTRSLFLNKIQISFLNFTDIRDNILG